MPGVNTTGSPNIAFLDSKIAASLCDGRFCVDVTPSIYIGGGAANVLGANVQITNPYGVIVKPYGSNYEIAPDLSGGMDAVICFNIPTQAGNYQYGKYKVEVQLFDDAGNWTVTKFVSLCPPDSKNKTRNYGSLSARLDASCKDGKLYVIVDGVPNYNGAIVESQVNDFTLEYPTSSTLSPLTTSLGSFSVQLYEGVYKLNGEICATYNFGDNVYVSVKYKVKREKNVRCLIDECCVLERLAELNKRLKDSCTTEEQQEIASTTVEALWLLKMVHLAADCGQDPSEYVEDLEKLLGCTCTCNCAEGTPVIDTTPAKDFSITGCNVTKNTVGLTDNYTIENYAYTIEITDNGGVLTVSGPVLEDCTWKQTIVFNLSTLYSQIKGQANQNTTEADFWSSVINKSLADIDPACLGVSQGTWNGWTLKQKIAAIVEKFCDSVSCDAAVSGTSITQQGNDALLQWTNNASVFCIDIYLDGILKGTVCPGLANGIDSFLFTDVGDYEEHTWMMAPKCSNGAVGTLATGTFQFAACPEIAPPVVSTNLVNGVECPFDLTSILTPPPPGITVEWHTDNNTNESSLVGDPTQVTSGIYFAFSKDTDGCYSMSTQVTVVCEVETSCTAPQALEVVNWTGGPVPGHPGANVLVKFKSAAYPPPANSYTVKRRLASDPDVPGSYTTVGTPVWSSFFNRWVIWDEATQNTKYVWRAFSNCGGSPATTPSVDFTFARFICSVVDTTPDFESVEYSMATTNANEVTKYEINLYDETGALLLHTDTYTPAFSDPITGTFEYLTSGTTYLIKVTAYIGTDFKTSCATTSFTTPIP